MLTVFFLSSIFRFFSGLELNCTLYHWEWGWILEFHPQICRKNKHWPNGLLSKLALKCMYIGRLRVVKEQFFLCVMRVCQISNLVRRHPQCSICVMHVCQISNLVRRHAQSSIMCDACLSNLKFGPKAPTEPLGSGLHVSVSTPVESLWKILKKSGEGGGALVSVFEMKGRRNSCGTRETREAPFTSQAL